jgi:hypothetical protein
MTRVPKRGTALVTAMAVLMVVFFTGSAILSLSLQSLRRGRFDALRARALALAEAGAERAIMYVRTTAPDGSTDGTWRTNGCTETVTGQGTYRMVVQDGSGANAGKLVITSTGTADQGSIQTRRSVRTVIKITREDVSIWNNAIFGGVGQAGRSVNGNTVIRGSVHLLGDGEPFDDVDLDQRWDSGESFTDKDGDSKYDIGEPWTDSDGDGHYDARESFDDVNGNATRDPALTVTDLASEISGSASMGNNYQGMVSNLRSQIPNPPTTAFGGETVETLNAKLRSKHGRVNVSGSASIGFANATAGSPMVKETMDGTYVSDGYGGTKGASSVYSDNGTTRKYDLGDGMVTFPTLTAPVTKGGVTYASYMDYLQTVGMVVSGPLNITKGTAYGPISDGKGNSISVSAGGVVNISGIVYVDGDINFNRNGGDRELRYTGRGTVVATGSIYVHTDLYPTGGNFPAPHVMGMIARRRIELATGSGDSQLTMAGAYYAQEQVVSAKQNSIAGTFVSSYFSMTNVPNLYQVPDLTNNMPPGMPGDQRIWVKSVRIDSWREVAAS